MRVRTALLAATAAALLVPAASQAATLGMEGNTLVYRGEGSEGNSLLLTDYSDWETGTTFLSFYDSGTDHVQINTSLCQDHEYGGIICERDLNRPIRIEGSERQGQPVDLRQRQRAGLDPDHDQRQRRRRPHPGRLRRQRGRTLNGGAGIDEIDGYAGNDAHRRRRRQRQPRRRRGQRRRARRRGRRQVDGDGYKTPGADLVDGGPGYDYVDGWGDPQQLQRQPTVTSRSTAWPTTAAPARATT